MLVTFFEEFFFPTGSTIDKLVFVLNRQIFSFDIFFQFDNLQITFFWTIIIVLTYFWLIFVQNLLFQKKLENRKNISIFFKLNVTRKKIEWYLTKSVISSPKSLNGCDTTYFHYSVFYGFFFFAKSLIVV